MIVEGNFADLLEPGLRRVFDTVAGRPDPMRDMLYNMVDSTKAEEHYTGFGSMDFVPVYTGEIKYEQFDQYYKTTIVNQTLVRGIQVERTLLEDDQYNEIRARVTRVGDVFPSTKEHDAAQTFINAFTDSGTNRLGLSVAGADAVGLVSTAHPYSSLRAGSTQSNEGTLALNKTNFETTRQLMKNLTDDRGNLMNVMPNAILVPTELATTAYQIVSQRALMEPGSAEFNANPHAGRFELIEWNRLTDANAWFLLDTNLMKQHLIWQDRVQPTFEQAPNSNTEVALFHGRMRYSTGWSHWSFVYGQNPS
ncbi:MAG: Mu-like prophage major head subunit gpT family protein [Gemmatimonadaceae bacterium]|nr:Mu-like prophage major head subunit gpT family protein [Gemmatimonadaceae bacterium]